MVKTSTSAKATYEEFCATSSGQYDDITAQLDSAGKSSPVFFPIDDLMDFSPQQQQQQQQQQLKPQPRLAAHDGPVVAADVKLHLMTPQLKVEERPLQQPQLTSLTRTFGEIPLSEIENVALVVDKQNSAFDVRWEHHLGQLDSGLLTLQTQNVETSPLVALSDMLEQVRSEQKTLRSAVYYSVLNLVAVKKRDEQEKRSKWLKAQRRVVCRKKKTTALKLPAKLPLPPEMSKPDVGEIFRTMQPHPLVQTWHRQQQQQSQQQQQQQKRELSTVKPTPPAPPSSPSPSFFQKKKLEREQRLLARKPPPQAPPSPPLSSSSFSSSEPSPIFCASSTTDSESDSSNSDFEPVPKSRRPSAEVESEKKKEKVKVSKRKPKTAGRSSKENVECK